MPSTSPHTSSRARSYLIALVSAAVLSTTAVLIRHLTVKYHVPALVLAFWRDIFVILTLLPVLGLLYPGLLKIHRRQIGFLMIFGFVLALFNSFWTLAVEMNGAAVATVLIYSSAAFTVILEWWFLREPLVWARVITVGICISGCTLVSGAYNPATWQAHNGNVLAGILVGVLSGLMYAIYSLMGRSASRRELNPWTTLFYTFAFAAVFLLIFNLAAGNHLPGGASHPKDFFWLGNAVEGWVVLFLLGAGPTVVGFGLYNLSMVHLPSSVANLILTSEPVFTAVTAYIFLGERMTGNQMAGSLLIVGGVIFLRIYEGWTDTRSNQV